MPIDLRPQKQSLRDVMKARRAEAQAENPNAATALRDCFLKSVSLPSQSIIASFSAFGSEIDPSPLTEALRALGHSIALPVVVAAGKPLLFRRYESGDRLATSKFGVAEPLPTAPEMEPDILLVPLLAFDRQRYRLGYGGGYYDRTITHLRQIKPLLTIGLAYACQEVAEVPHGKHDARLDKIVTEIHAF